MKTRRFFLILLAVLTAASLCVTAALAEGEGAPQIIVSGAVGEITSGDTVTLTVSLANNPGINTFTLKIDYDTARLKLTGVTPDAALGGTFTYSETTETAAWQAGSDTTYNGPALTLNFTVLDGAAAGSASVSVSYQEGNICNYAEEDVNFTVVPGAVAVKELPCAHAETELKNQKDATCAEEGYTGDEVCVSCGGTLETGEVIPKTAHTWNEGDVITAATCTEDGEKTVTCTVCGATENQVIPANGHTWDKIEVKKEATETAEGERLLTCSVCGATKTESIPKLPPVSIRMEKDEENGWVLFIIENSRDLPRHVFLNGTELSETDYMLLTNDSGDVVQVVFEQEYWNTLKDGQYTLKVVCDDGSQVSMDFTIGAAAGGTTGGGNGGSGGGTKNSPKTGDETNIALWAVLFVLCVAAGAVMAAKKPRKD